MYRRERFAAAIFFGVLNCLFLFAIPASEVTGGEHLGIGRRIPAFTLKDQHGKEGQVNEQQTADQEPPDPSEGDEKNIREEPEEDDGGGFRIAGEEKPKEFKVARAPESQGGEFADPDDPEMTAPYDADIRDTLSPS